MKKVLLILIDAFNARVTMPALAAGRLPNLAALSKAGLIRDDSVAIFPSITPAATAAVITGCYPIDHGIPGAYWYDERENKVIYFGGDLSVIRNHGIANLLEEFAVKLNEVRLKGTTLFEYVETAGLQAASLNYLIFHAKNEHEMSGNLLTRLLTGGRLSGRTVGGPSLLYFGDLIETPLADTGEPLNSAGGPFHRLGFDDQSSAELLANLIENHTLPELTVAYFPDNDFRSHEVGPDRGLEAVEVFDRHLGCFFDAAGGMDALLDEVCVIITGDHAQTAVVSDAGAANIDLAELLQDFDVSEAGTPMSEQDELVICPNLRVAQIYFNRPTHALQDQVVDRLLSDDRVDQALWPGIVFNEQERGFHVATRTRGRLHFWQTDETEARAKDDYGNHWTWKGDLQTVDGQVRANGRLIFEDYPNAFERIASGLNGPSTGHLWVTARPGYEFTLPGISVHNGGGSHGSLHVDDSTVPLIIAGSPSEVKFSAPPRSIDLAPFCGQVLGLPEILPAKGRAPVIILA